MKKAHIVTFVGILCGLAMLGTAAAQSEPAGIPEWAAVVHRMALKANRGPASRSPGVFPAVIPSHLNNPDASGIMESFNPAGSTKTSESPFFQPLGTNGRACATCHEPRSAWGVSAASIRRRFASSRGTDPIFRPVDGATCDTDDVSTVAARRTAYRLLLSKGLIRIFLPLPVNQLGTPLTVARNFEITAINDPYGCTDLSSSPPMVSVYRRPLPAANLRFLTECPNGNPGCAPLSIMWDGREQSLESQAIDATLGHSQALDAPPGEVVAQIVAFESQIFDAQIFDKKAGRLDRLGATGGPVFLSQQDFFIGINDSLTDGFNPVAFTIYDGWRNLHNSNRRNAARASIARGQALFNSREFTISGVNGLNLLPTDPVGPNPIVNGTCTTCHDSPNVGNHSKVLAIDIGVADANPPALDVSELPIFTVKCTAGPLAGQIFSVTDLGRAMISGRCADVGKIKGPILHGLTARAPYFHNGSAATLDDVVDFYNQRFSIGLTAQEKKDLAAFLNTL